MPAPINRSMKKNTDFTQDYKMKLFMIWYNAGKPNARKLHSIVITEDIKEAYSGDKPSLSTVTKWVSGEFEAKATKLDLEANRAIENQLIATKIEMLREHAVIGNKLHKMGMEHLEEFGLGNARNALSAIVEGIRVERESKGTERLTELDKLSDGDLLAELGRFIDGSKLLIEPND